MNTIKGNSSVTSSSQKYINFNRYCCLDSSLPVKVNANSPPAILVFEVFPEMLLLRPINDLSAPGT